MREREVKSAAVNTSYGISRWESCPYLRKHARHSASLTSTRKHASTFWKASHEILPLPSRSKVRNARSRSSAARGTAHSCTRRRRSPSIRCSRRPARPRAPRSFVASAFSAFCVSRALADCGARSRAPRPPPPPRPRQLRARRRHARVARAVPDRHAVHARRPARRLRVGQRVAARRQLHLAVGVGRRRLVERQSVVRHVVQGFAQATVGLRPGT